MKENKKKRKRNNKKSAYFLQFYLENKNNQITKLY